MADVYCGNCGEPCEVYHLEHDMEPYYREMFKAGTGCDCCKGKTQKVRPLRAMLASAMLDILGDDTDGIAAMMEDEEATNPEFWT